MSARRGRSGVEFDPCPMGCGHTTDDPYGGPCSSCWDEVPTYEERRDAVNRQIDEMVRAFDG